MQIKSNTLLKVIVPVVLLSAAVIGVKSCGSSKQTQDSADNTAVADLTQEELRILGIEGDTPQDTLRTLVGRIKTIQTNQANLEKQNATLAEENARLQNKGNNVDGRLMMRLTPSNRKVPRRSKNFRLNSSGWLTYWNH